MKQDRPREPKGRSSQCRVGTSGWVYPHWRGVFYPPNLPQSRWFDHYARTFDTVEINNTFYRLPATETFERWREQAPPGFTFAVKANRYLTHVRRLKECTEPLARFLERVRRLGTHLGPILYQLPPRWHPDLERLAAFLDLLPEDLVHVFEFRDPRWFTEPVRALLAERSMAFCIFNAPGIECPRWVTAPVVYLRFHGSAELYAGRYSREKLAAWAEFIRHLLAEGYQVYAYFNNDAYGHAVINAQELRELVEAHNVEDAR